jgi:hypothetical protein
VTPNCDACNHGDHPECAQRGQMRQVVCECQCETATQARRMLRVDQETGDGIPNYALLDLWMALGYEPGHEFDDAVIVRGKADVWAWLLAEVRQYRDGLKAIEREEAKAAGQAENGDPMYLRAKALVEQFRQIEEVESKVMFDNVVTNARGDVVSGTLRAVVSIEGTVH